MSLFYHVKVSPGPRPGTSYRAEPLHLELYALTQAQAVATALELAGPGARMLRVWREGDW
jgi:hypothetical protein